MSNRPRRGGRGRFAPQMDAQRAAEEAEKVPGQWEPEFQPVDFEAYVAKAVQVEPTGELTLTLRVVQEDGIRALTALHAALGIRFRVTCASL